MSAIDQKLWKLQERCSLQDLGRQSDRVSNEWPLPTRRARVCRAAGAEPCVDSRADTAKSTINAAKTP
jgi:hypothetical protein